MNVSIRNLAESDVEKVYSLIQRNGPFVATYNIYAYWILSKYNTTTCKVALIDNKVIGVITGIQSLEQKVVFIWQFCVDENYRRQNIGFMLIDSLVQSSIQIGASTIEFTITENNDKSILLFRKYAKVKELELIEIRTELIGEMHERVFKIAFKYGNL